MAATGQLSVSDVADTAVVALSNCKNIRVFEDLGSAAWGKSDFLVKKPTAAATGMRVRAGNDFTFRCEGTTYRVGEIAGYIRMVTAATSTTFDQDEDASESSGNHVAGVAAGGSHS